ncbi:MAG: type II toxin-antitoxin system PemK/MazF family toxin [Sinomicrobium sp.]|nr:type II toxin-antitoxin system PemK/MazF family toxin [Sinomicrobium sp.]
MKYKKGDIAIIAFPFSDLSGTKKRPALILSNATVNKTGDYLMVQITSKLRNDVLSLRIAENDYMNATLLPLPSCIRLHKLFLLNERLIMTKYTALTPEFMDVVKKGILNLL